MTAIASGKKTIFVSPVGPGGPYITTFRRFPADTPWYEVGESRRDAIEKMVAKHPEAAGAEIEPE